MTNTTKKPAMVYVIERQHKGKGPWRPLSMTTTQTAARADLDFFNEQNLNLLTSTVYRRATYQRVERP